MSVNYLKREFMDQKLKKWIKWLKVIESEIVPLVEAKDIFWSLQEMIKENIQIQKPSRFYNYMGNTYQAFILMGIRRQVKIDNQSISFARLLLDIECYPDKISRKYYLQIGDCFTANNDFDRFCDNPEDPHISSKIVHDDLIELKKVACICENFADRTIAHRDKRESKIIPRFRDADDAVDCLEKLYVKYHNVFHAEWMEDLKAPKKDWKKIFNYPWRLKTKDI
jgi:hypothetical protein